ncbi:MAG: ribose-phosphate pyrophosphokinase [bacterium]|nr:ribose-phosphate pyrophosphokinase [bacterium]
MSTRLKIFSGSSHQKFAKAICEHLQMDLGGVLIKRFASNEIYVRLQETVRGYEVFVVQTATRNVNEDFMELFLLCDTLKRSFAKKVHVVMPFFGYARQDRVAAPRETISAKLMADLLVASGADHVMTVALHSDQIQGFFDVPVDNINPSRLFVEYIQSLKLRDAVVVTPDAGGAKEAKKFADSLGCPLAVLNKQRAAHNQSEVTHVIGDVKGRTCIVYDDMIDTAGSVCHAKEALEKAGAGKDMYLAATHAVLSGEAVDRLNKADFRQIVVTDSIPLPEERLNHLHVLTLTPLLAEIIKRVESGESVSGLY